MGDGLMARVNPAVHRAGWPVMAFGLAAVALLWSAIAWDLGREADRVAALGGAHILVGGLLTLILGGATLLLTRQVRRQIAAASDLAEKTAALTDSRERLRRYVSDLERFAEISAHDLQEPLRRVVAYAQLLALHSQSALDEEGRAYVAQVVNGAQQMHKLVRDLEAFVAADHFPPVEHPVPAGESMAAALAKLAGRIDASGGAVMVDTLPMVAADRGALTEIFVHLIDNSLRYGVAGRKPLVHVGASMAGAMVEFTVRDNGSGIDRRYSGRVFEMFSRLDGESHGGTGMGLAVVRRMVERMGGRIWFKSVPGEGSTFSFTLPSRVPQSSDQDARVA